MAESAAHKWGQIIGDLLQHSLWEELQKVANRHQLYLDYQRNRPARKGSRVSWQDRYGNSHDLDYVLERGGTDTTIGFHISYDDIMSAFASVGIDARFDERTAERRFREKIKQCQALTPTQLTKLKEALLTSPQPGSAPLKEFLATLEASLSRCIVGITVLVLHGQSQQMLTIAEAIQYLDSYEESRPSSAAAIKYEIDVRYNNGNVIHGIFQTKEAAIRFLGHPTP